MEISESDQMKLEEARADMERSRRVTELLAMQVWKKDLEPMIAEIQDEAQEAVMWPPSGNVDASSVAVKDAFFKGQFQAMAELGRKLGAMRDAGEQAAKEIERIEARSKQG